MILQAAHVDQVRRARDGRMVVIDADAGGVAEELQRIDPGLKVRFAEHGEPPFWAVFHESEDRLTTTLVLTVQAHQGATGAWSGLDHRVVERVREIDSHGRGGYDFGKELEQTNQRIRKASRDKFHDEIASHAPELMHAARKDLGIKSKAFIAKKPKGML